jgi:hypothetical protein
MSGRLPDLMTGPAGPSPADASGPDVEQPLCVQVFYRGFTI